MGVWNTEDRQQIDKKILTIKRNKIIFKQKVMKDNTMASYLGYTAVELEDLGALHTAREIAGQPDLWQSVWQELQRSYQTIMNKMGICLTSRECDIILTGAGTSAYIGELLAGWLARKTGRRVRAVPTTDIVTHPEYIFKKETPTLLVSFARSGNSPESVAALDLANQICEQIDHLIITCNPEGQLIKRISGKSDSYFLMPPEADDQSLAMTGSFSGMALAGLILLGGGSVEDFELPVKRFIDYGRYFFTQYPAGLKKLAELSFHRGVFLGSGAMQGSAHEGHLKLQELTDGRVICKFDSFLGFRHGPKAVIDRETLNVFMLSSDKYVSKYETDLVADINRGEKGCFRLGISEYERPDLDLDLNIYFARNPDSVPEPLLAVLCVLPAQVLGFYKSVNLGLKPDAPSVSGTITRVVQGVHIYPYRENC
jgi:tagatose-6-phosphate ketose/aldose isomerase